MRKSTRVLHGTQPAHTAMGVLHSRSDPNAQSWALALPRWVRFQLRGDGSGRTQSRHVAGDLVVEGQHADGLAIYSCAIEDAVSMDAAALREAVHRVYQTLSKICEAHSVARYPLRYWNFIPAINEIVCAGLDRYMVFNMGRHDAMSRSLGEADAMGGGLPTATAIGHRAAHLAVHCLAGSRPPMNVENPRQIPAFQYSAAYGPKPPSFSRASWTSLRGKDTLLVGGTSSVRGEASVHIGDVRAQLHETLENLRTLVTVAFRRRGRALREEWALTRFRHARAYVVRPSDALSILDELRREMPNVADIEINQACICRSQLLIEIEGVVDSDGA